MPNPYYTSPAMQDMYTQRLTNMEQMGYGYQPPQYNPQRVQGPQIKSRIVSSIDEVKATMIDFDGSLNIFIDKANNKIYTKQLQNDGSATILSYGLEEQKAPAPTPVPDYISRSEFDKFRASLENILKQGGTNNEQSNANVSNDKSVKK